MERFIRGSGIVALGALLLSGSVSAAVLRPTPVTPVVEQGIHVNGYPQAKPMFLTFPAQGIDANAVLDNARAGLSLPLWSSSVTYKGTKYTYMMVGNDPTSGSPATVPVQFFALKMVFADGTVFDPTKPTCGDSQTVMSRIVHSPIFNDDTDYVSNGVDVGKTQYLDAFQRAEFWKVLGGSGYHVLLSKKHNPFQVYTVVVPKDRGNVYSVKTCNGKIGVVNINWFFAKVLTPFSKMFKAWQLPMIYMYDVFQSPDGKISDCCYLGYHLAYGNRLHTLGVATYNDPKIFNAPIEDIHAMTHEIGEWMNDPTGGNPTPPWGHIGQVAGCQNNLEVGDPLTGTLFKAIRLHGFTYHPQELAFFSWFYRQKPSIGTGYSFGGTFKAPQPICQ